ncbi:MAG: hypothetical protein DWB56_09485 [Candidatus Jettenia sp.]|uniref:SSD domain-containing protein n=1 Tax=Candidatus Jettenia caeni TaxID=247490 RepID=I3IPN6_9BACT|nr:MMPL family transporter [Candidatus Jettenia sp. AMX1]MBC6929178.1 hypothetical protein [Candidatus Jettenia sp.]GAB63681.1 conserved hypothetical protein [Candidatus Jettenia caeni]KAA0250235.1 MAG: hypothetical protein EDM77_05985 [Candidatus Jettenia sp. AMX1]MCE7880533.1 hypothetical protein [Candidatus Jettenia sp. AMX1]MCQ3927334.1 hypothetical protein [Candidatus Jettenia sp.]
MENYIRTILKYRKVILACIAVITLFLGYSAKNMRTDNSIEIWLSKNDADLDYYKKFLNTFGDEEFLVIAFSSVTLFTGDRIKEINTIAERLKKLNGIVQVISLADVFKDTITSSLFKAKIKAQNDRSYMNIFKQHILTDPMYQNTIISKNGKTTAIIATVKSPGPESRRQLISEVRTLLHEMTDRSGGTKDRKSHYHLAGPSVVNAELDRMSKQDMARFTPFMFLMSIIVLGCLLRKVSGVFVSLLTVGVCILWVTGCFVLLGQTMNMISNMLLPLTFIISLSTSIHLVSHYYHERNFSISNEDAVYNTIQHIGIPIFMTSITTVIGFISLATSSIPPVFITGLFMAGCAALTFVISLTCIPILLSFIPHQISVSITNAPDTGKGHTVSLTENWFAEGLDKEYYFHAMLSWLGGFIVKHKTLILLCGLTAGTVSVLGISRIRIESDIMASFPKNSQIARDNNYIERHLMGLLPVEIVAKTTDGVTLLQPDILNNLACLQRYLYSIPEVTSSLSMVNYIQKAHQRATSNKPQHSFIPNTEKEIANYMKLASFYGGKQVHCLHTEGYTDARISVRMKQVGSNRYQTIIQSIKEHISQHLNTTALSWHITGIIPLLINVQDNILRSEIQSFSLAFLLTFISTVVVLKSVRIGLISIIPNVLPITITLGLMGFTGMKLDAATIMIASIALGISVDNTIHIFYRFKKEFSRDADYSKAVCRTLQGAGKTALFTSLSAAFGFMVFSFSGFKPIQYFGMLTSVTMVNAIVSDLFISPSCLMLFKPRF